MSEKSKDRRADEAERNAQRRVRDHGDLDPSDAHVSSHSHEGEAPADSRDPHDTHKRDDEPLH